MIVDNAILKRLAARFGVSPISKLDPQVLQILQSGEHFIKAPAGFEPLITGGGYVWDDNINGYRLGQHQKIFLLPNGIALWTFKDVLARGIAPNSIQKWVSADTEYPMGKANAFLIVYGKLTGQDLGQDDTAGDDVPDGETEPQDGGGLATADDENAPEYSKQDIQKMLKGEFPSDVSSGPSMASSIPVAGGEEPVADIPVGKPSGPPPDRSKVGNPLSPPKTADELILRIYKAHKRKPNEKPSKQYPIRMSTDKIIDLWHIANSFSPEEKEKMITFLKSGVIQQHDVKEGHISKDTLETLMEHVINTIVQEVDKAKTKAKAKKIPDAKKPVAKPKDGDFHDGSAHSKPTRHSQTEMSGTGAVGPVSGPNAFKKDRPLEEMTTTSGGGGSSPGTPGYNIPGAFSGEGGSKAGVRGSAKLGYHLTPIGKKDMKRKADKLYESVRNDLKQMIADISGKKKSLKESSGLGPDFDRAQQSYDKQLPPENDNLMCPNCGGINGYYTEKGGRHGAYWWNAECPECGESWGDDNFDAMDDR